MFTLTPSKDTGYKFPGASKVYTAEPTGGVIDVISDLTFTATPITPYLQNTIPHIILTEYEVLYNSTIASALYYSRFVTESLGIDAPGLERKLGEATTGVYETLAKKIIKSAEKSKDTVSSTISIKDQAIGLGATTAKTVGKALTDLGNASDEFKDDVLKAYNGLYLRKPTGFQYILPFFDDKKRNISNNYSTTNDNLQSKGISELVGAGTGVIDKVLGVLTALEPGAYIEIPQFYNLPEGETVEVNFDLINTINPDDYIKHHNFLFLLAFQNTPYRKDLARISPPKLYRCDIPGDQIFPFCYISRMDINFKGTRRRLPVTIPGLGTRESIIPDAYSVTMTIKSLNPSSGNFMVASQNVRVE